MLACAHAVLLTKCWATTCLPRYAQVAVSSYHLLSLSSHSFTVKSKLTLTDTLSLLLSAASDQHQSPSPHLSLRRQQSLDIEKQLYRPIFSQNSAANAPNSRNSSLGGGGGFAESGGGEQPPLTPTSVSVPPEIRRGSETQFCQGVSISSKPYKANVVNDNGS